MQARLLKSISSLYKGSILNKTTIFSLTPLSRATPAPVPPQPPYLGSSCGKTRSTLRREGQEGQSYAEAESRTMSELNPRVLTLNNIEDILNNPIEALESSAEDVEPNSQ